MKTKPLTIKVPSDIKQRLDIFVSEFLDISRSQVQKLIEQNQIVLNNKLPKKAGDRVKEGDTITYHPEAPITPQAAIPVSKKTTPLSKKQPDYYKITKIISKNPEYIVVDKPSGLLTHPTMAHEEKSLASFLLKKYPEIKTIGEDPLRPGIVHRLDKEASGLLVAARTQKMFKHLKTQFKNRTIEKEYLVLVHGRVAKDVDTISFPIARGRTNERMSARPRPSVDDDSELPPGEKEALTEFIIEQRFVNFTLLRVKIHTGRMHQIRVHLLAYNHPVVGDPLYNQKKRKNMWDKKLGRLFLHATHLAFADLAGETQMFASPLPPELVHFLKLLA